MSARLGLGLLLLVPGIIRADEKPKEPVRVLLFVGSPSREYQAVRAACPENVLTRTWGDGRVQEFRWVLRLDYQDSDGRWWKLNALECTERTADKGLHYFAWLTGLPLVPIVWLIRLTQVGGGSCLCPPNFIRFTALAYSSWKPRPESCAAMGSS